MTHAISLSVIENVSPATMAVSDALRQALTERAIQTPMLLLSRLQVARNFKALAEALPRVDIHYAVKPNCHPSVLREISDLGGNFDVCSRGEIDLVTSVGANAASLIHSHPVKSIPEFDAAVERGVETFVVDNPEEIKKFSRYREKKLKVLIRYRIATNTSAVVNLQYKFGCVPADVLQLAQLTRDAGHEFYGLCFHIGSQCIYSDNYVRAIETASSLIRELDMDGFNTRLMDIGGGFPVQYAQPIPEIDEFCRPIRTALHQSIRPGIKIISEPGRFISANPVTLVCSIIGKALRDGKVWYYLDDGLYSTFSGIVYDQCQYPVINIRDGEEHLSVLAGPTCDSFDVMYDGLMMPEHEVGDRIAFASTGAYCDVSGSNFNALKRPEYMVID